jgi:CheY-like chemotaxis protein
MQEATWTVLVVDDNVELIDSLQLSLELLGNFRVVSATNGDDGLVQAITLLPDCVIVDIKMPGLDGYQFVRVMRGDTATASIPLIVLTALAQDKNRFLGLAAGADAYMTKPVNPQDLVAMIQHVITLRRQDRLHRLQGLVDELSNAE